MYTTEEATSERVAAYLGALEDEKTQLALGLTQAKDAEDDKRVLKLEKRIKANAAEIARVKKDAGKESKESKESSPA